jgi:hypothetical protein
MWPGERVARFKAETDDALAQVECGGDGNGAPVSGGPEEERWRWRAANGTGRRDDATHPHDGVAPAHPHPQHVRQPCRPHVVAHRVPVKSSL